MAEHAAILFLIESNKKDFAGSEGRGAEVASGAEQVGHQSGVIRAILFHVERHDLWPFGHHDSGGP